MFGPKQLEFLRKKKYLEKGETPESRIKDIVGVVRKYESEYSKGLADRVEALIKKKKLSLSTPQLANLGRERIPGKNTIDLNCSCNITTVPNSISGIYYSIGETAMLSKLGAGVGGSWLEVADKNSFLSEGFYTNSKLDWVEDQLRASQKVSQGAKRRGYSVPFFSFDDPEFGTILERNSKTNPDKKDPFITNNIGFVMPVGFRTRVKNGDAESQRRFLKVLSLRKATGKAYLVDIENMNKNQSPVYKILKQQVVATNICTEVVTPFYEDKTFACIIASLNAMKMDEITDQDIKDMFMFLDINVSEYIKDTEGVPFLEKARRSAIEKRDIGLGVLGFHDLLQSKGYAVGDMYSRSLNKAIFSRIRKLGEEVTKEMALKLGSPKMCEEAGLIRRNVSLMMVAPNKSTAFFMDTTEGCGLRLSNYFISALAGIQVVEKNKILMNLLEEKGKNTPEIWESILTNLGSVKHLDFLDDREKSIFKTASEVSPKDILDLAADRQEFIDMAQSINLYNRPNYSLQDIYNIHMYAFDKGIKTLYYFYPQAHAALEQEGENWDACEGCAD
ncbi:ribonucleoside-diphosphate reductase alpha subunit [Cellulophaga phage phi4:1]|uniref:Ribonucleoside-diphosphate reductase alpha subunit n=5 Tax=Lightbulbvirus TaxID=1918522 RepID=A0A0S2MWT5_9CAUD|nr:ribonucleotide reductase [Cellulophaga phage phi4:1]YP_008241676.1 ribonucleotide reductase [Cellulophaga phage phi17:2]ALO80186.1 ribonucleoside-diphosphate reductase alpha subunit [Cellulophaga phage phi4:1_13]ALO80383.1 ribonucleoside-diphosphate reductase alpha subunit [Cellulophaga phage phi4:1_18]ALO80584.1 ribonucleoside-diphosphate reductase alpha subunit [Cellulophaga phage phi17:2_18]AGO47714.1 ribonucleoside-diphosphate reductase alpha subunit [Cellulophaga phage phi17:2]AGO4959